MARFIGVCVVLFVLAVGFVALTQGAETAALLAAFRAESFFHKIAWIVIGLVPIAMIVVAAWLSDTLGRHRKVNTALERRLDGVREGVRELTRSQAEAEASVHHLARTDPDEALGALQRRLTEAERSTHVQQTRHEGGDLSSRVEDIRSQQQALKARLAPVLDTRRSVEQVLAELDGRQGDLERTLTEIASGDDAVALEVRLKNLIEFVRQSHARCDQIEQASKTVAGLKEGMAELRVRLGPYAAVDDGITSRVNALRETRDRLAADVDSLAFTPEGPLADRVQRFAEDKNKLDEHVTQLSGQFLQLSGLRADVARLFVELDGALAALSSAKGSNGAGAADAASAVAHLAELTEFIEQTQGRLTEVEQRVAAFEQLRRRLGELQARLAPLESEDSGVVKLVGDLQDIRDRLVVKIRSIEGGEEGDLAARVKVFAQTKQELEERVASLSDQFTRLATIRRDISGLFDKLSGAISASST